MANVKYNFTINELIRSRVANKIGLVNYPNDEQLESLKRLIRDVLQPIRDKWGKPIIVTSGFRSDLLNRAIGGAKNSQHKRGEAADIKTETDSREENGKLFELIKSMINNKEIEVGQLIDEHNLDWIHVSLPTLKTNNQILKL